MTRPTAENLKAWGTSLREIDPTSLVQDEAGLKVRWYLGDNGTELYCWVHPDERPDHLQLVFARVSVEWSQNKGLTTGTFQSGASMAGGRYDPYLLSVGKEVDREVCEAALKLLESSAVDKALTAPMVDALTRVLGR